MSIILFSSIPVTLVAETQRDSTLKYPVAVTLSSGYDHFFSKRLTEWRERKYYGYQVGGQLTIFNVKKTLYVRYAFEKMKEFWKRIDSQTEWRETHEYYFKNYFSIGLSKKYQYLTIYSDLGLIYNFHYRSESFEVTLTPDGILKKEYFDSSTLSAKELAVAFNVNFGVSITSKFWINLTPAIEYRFFSNGLSTYNPLLSRISIGLNYMIHDHE
ncbi:hypothetical protein JYU23_00985 [bacterium AH-315-C07]|nr:hypothetical protein [bacterium AH-315-C07]